MGEKSSVVEGVLEEEDYLFRQPGGIRWCRGHSHSGSKMILREGNLPDNLNVHSLRHTNASMLIAQGVDVRTVAGLLGHAQPGTTLDIYSHAFDKNKNARTGEAGRGDGTIKEKGKTALGIPRAVLVRLTGLEPAAFRVGAERSIQLSYDRLYMKNAVTAYFNLVK